MFSGINVLNAQMESFALKNYEHHDKETNETESGMKHYLGQSFRFYAPENKAKK